MPELRKDPIIGRWVIISTERGRRPSDFGAAPPRPRGGFCPFCPGNEDKTPPEVLAIGEPGRRPNTPGWTLRVVPNKFPALRIEGELDRSGDGVYDRMNGIGAHEVIIETPEHEATLATLPPRRVLDVLWAFQARINDLRNDTRFRYVLVFKNHGEAAGATLEHAHSQLIALPIIPKEVVEELEGMRRYYLDKERCLLCDIVKQETAQQVRVVAEDTQHLVIEPFAPRFPFETWLIPKRHEAAYEAASRDSLESLARLLSETLRRLDKVLGSPPYNFILHTFPLRQPASGGYDPAAYHWHFEVIPKLTRVGGFEWGSDFYINPTPPEEAAKFLREARL
ncbi:MAG TPA: galactose-1-phosphate uridylyltransferase [Thermodesulfobacteriota bacterium]|nr:galactose-1-phosphate uridylyltransferase [Thermodesulfobacteriota bacterium]